MFDIAFSELVIIGIVALVVVGPEKLPKVVRTVGLLLGMVQCYVNNLKSYISRELRFEELQRLQADVRDTESAFKQAGVDIGQDVQKIASLGQEIPELQITGQNRDDDLQNRGKPD